MVIRGQKLKMRKACENHSTRTLELFCAKNCLKKHLIFEKWDDFKNRLSCKGYSFAKGLTFVCARVWFKNKMPKRCKKGFLKDIRVLKIGRNFHLGKGLGRQNGLFSDWI